MHRRGFLASLIAFICAPFARQTAPELDWKTIPSTIAVGDISRATNPYWVDQRLPHDGEAISRAMRDLFDDCT